VDADRYVGTTIPHSDFRDPDCCGCLKGIVRGDIALIECNECSAIIRTVAAADLEKTLREMELSLDIASAVRLRPLRSGPSKSRLLAPIRVHL